MKTENKYIQFAVFVVFVVIFWNIYEIFISKMLTHADYAFNFMRDITQPLLFGTVLGYLFYLRRR